MKNPTPQEIGEKIIEVSGLDIYKNTRHNNLVEHRALMCYLMRDKLLMRWCQISRFFVSKGKSMHHSTAMHLVEMYPLYRRDDISLSELEDSFFFDSKMRDAYTDDTVDEMKYLENKYEKLEEKYLKMRNQLASLL